jgi:hypothetical protein
MARLDLWGGAPVFSRDDGDGFRALFTLGIGELLPTEGGIENPCVDLDCRPRLLRFLLRGRQKD